MLLKIAKRDIRPRLLPLVLSAGVILADQVVKLVVSLVIERGKWVPVIGDFFRIGHVRNTAIGFSIGRSLAAGTQRTLFFFLPLAVTVIILLYYLLTRDPLTRFQRWTMTALIGGGFGNWVDRIFRPDGVVDFLDFKFYGLLGMERWPTFNVADMTVVVSCILLFISFLLPGEKKT